MLTTRVGAAAARLLLLLAAAATTHAAAVASTEEQPAKPRRTASEPTLQISLTNQLLAVTEQLFASTDGTPVRVEQNTTYDSATVDCIEVCLPEFHCALYDRDDPALLLRDVGPGKTAFASTRVGQVVCGEGLPGEGAARRSVAAAQARYDGRVAFRNSASGKHEEFDFELGRTVKLGIKYGYDRYYTGATVEDLSATYGGRVWSCEAFTAEGASLGVFYASERYINTFVPGVVDSFLCDY